MTTILNGYKISSQSVQLDPSELEHVYDLLVPSKHSSEGVTLKIYRRHQRLQNGNRRTSLIAGLDGAFHPLVRA